MFSVLYFLHLYWTYLILQASMLLAPDLSTAPTACLHALHMRKPGLAQAARLCVALHPPCSHASGWGAARPPVPPTLQVLWKQLATGEASDVREDDDDDD